MKKIITIMTAAFAVIIIGFIALIKTYVTADRVREYLIPVAERSLHRKIIVGDVKIILLKGIKIRDFVVREKDGQTDFLKCKDFVLKFQLLPLLSKKIVIDELKLESPEIKITRDSKGRFNYEDLGEKEKAGILPEGKKLHLPVSLLVNNVSVKDSKFSFVDELKKLPDAKGSFSIKAGVKSTDGSELFSEGRMQLTLDEIIFRKKTMKDIKASLAYAVHIIPWVGNIRIDRADLNIQGIPASITGNVKNLKKEPAIDIAVSVPKLRIPDLQQELSTFPTVKKLSLSGNISADIKLKGMPGKIETLKADGIVSFEKTGIRLYNINAVVDGDMKFRERSVNFNIIGSAGNNTAAIKGSVSNYFRNPALKLNLYSKQLFLDDLILAGTAKGAAATDGGPHSSAENPGEAQPLKLRLTAEGEVRVDSASYKGMDMSNFYARYHLRDNKFEIIKMAAVAGKGALDLNGTIDLSRPGYIYYLSGSLDSIPAEEITNSFFPEAKDAVFGNLSAYLRLSGAGTSPESVRKNLAGDGDFRLTDGKITNSKLTGSLAAFLNIDELRTIDLKKANGTIRIRNGVARLDSIFTSDDIAMDPAGYIGLDETLDLAFDLKLSPDLAKKTIGSDVAKYVRDEEGWGMIPLKLSGTLTNPSYAVDIAKAGKRTIKKEVDRFLDKTFKDKTNEKPAEDSTKEKQNGAEDLQKEILR